VLPDQRGAGRSDRGTVERWTPDTWIADIPAFCDALGIEHPIVAAPMANGPTTPELVAAVSEAGALGGASDHVVSKSLYGRDPDGNEFEIMWRVPREAWGEAEHKGAILPLDLDAELKRFGSAKPV